MNWIAAVFFALLGFGFVLARRGVAHYLGLTLGARLPAGCAVAQGAALFILALIILIVRPFD